MHLIDLEGNQTSPLFSIDEQRKHRMVVDAETNSIMFKDSPDTWHKLPVTKKGLMMLPLTQEACERHGIHPPPPKPQSQPRPQRQKKKQTCAKACCAEDEQ